MVDHLYEHILVPTDFRPVAREAYRVALAMAQGSNARITLLHVLPQERDAEFLGMDAIRLLHRAAEQTLSRWDRQRTFLSDRHEEAFKRLQAEIHPDWLSTVKVSVELRTGNTIAEIARFTSEAKVDLVVMASSRPKWSWRFGISADDRLSRRTSVKILRVVPPVRVMAK